MIAPAPHRARASLDRPRRRSAGRRRNSRRAVSDVVATILILALTVTLFASIFAFVGSFPQPPPQNVNQFQASLVLTSNKTYISGITIEHLAGPSIPGSDHVFLESAHTPKNWQFKISGGIPVYWGLSGNTSGTTWSFGQVWSTTFPHIVMVPDNITLYISTPYQLLYSTVLPGITITTPPAILNSGVNPSPVTIGEKFTVWASLGGTLSGLTATVNLAGIPGLSGNQTLTLAASGLYTYATTAGPTTAGTWYAVIYVSNSLGQLASTSVPVVVPSTGGSSPSQLTVSVGMSPQPPSVPLQTGTAYFWATITYTGSSTAKTCVNFTVVNHFAGHVKQASDYANSTLAGNGAGATTCDPITGPTTLTIYSSSTYSLTGLVSGSIVTVTAHETSTALGTASGSTVFDLSNVLGSEAYFTTTSTGGGGGSSPTGKVTTFSHSCVTSNNCPYLYYQLYDNFTTGLGGPGTAFTFAGAIYANSTTGGFTKSYTISTTLTAGASGVNVITDPAGTTTRFPLPGGSTGTIYNIVMYLKVTNTGGAVVGYLYTHFSITLT